RRFPRARAPVALPLHELANRLGDPAGHLSNQQTHREIGEGQREDEDECEDGGGDDERHNEGRRLRGSLCTFKIAKREPRTWPTSSTCVRSRVGPEMSCAATRRSGRKIPPRWSSDSRS